MGSREERIARNETTVLDISESTGRSPAHTGAPTGEGVHVRILCECGRLECDRLLAITIAEYETVRADPRRFAVARGHVMAVERVVIRTNRYAVVEKHQ